MAGIHPIARLMFDSDNHNGRSYSTTELNEMCDFVMETEVDGEIIPK